MILIFIPAIPDPNTGDTIIPPVITLPAPPAKAEDR